MTNEHYSGEEIEITPAMVEAGAGVLCNMALAFATEEFYAKEVYRAMVIAGRLPGNPSPVEPEIQRE